VATEVTEDDGDEAKDRGFVVYDQAAGAYVLGHDEYLSTTRLNHSHLRERKWV